MAEITKMKEVNVEIRKIYDFIELNSSKHCTFIALVAAENKLRMDAFQQNWEKFMQTQQDNAFNHGTLNFNFHCTFTFASG